jgi:hypothetical protein
LLGHFALRHYKTVIDALFAQQFFMGSDFVDASLFEDDQPVGVLQDFYATMFLTNLVAFAEMGCEEELELIHSSKENAYKYHINTTMAVPQSLLRRIADRCPQYISVKAPRPCTRQHCK